MASLVNKALDAAEIVFSGEAGLKVSIETIREMHGGVLVEADFVIERRLWGGRTTERDGDTRKPRLSLAVRHLSSKGSEKLSAASATAILQIEVLTSGERASDVQRSSGEYIDAVVDVLGRNRGLWANGVYYAGQYDVELKPLAKGGLNYTQACVFEIEVHLWQE